MGWNDVRNTPSANVMCDTVMSAEKTRENVTCEGVLFTAFVEATVPRCTHERLTYVSTFECCEPYS